MNCSDNKEKFATPYPLIGCLNICSIVGNHTSALMLKELIMLGRLKIKAIIPNTKVKVITLSLYDITEAQNKVNQPIAQGMASFNIIDTNKNKKKDNLYLLNHA